MNQLVRKIFFFLLFITITSLTKTEEVQNIGFRNSESVAFMPISSFISNDLSNFQQSWYIDRKIERFMERSELQGVSVALVDNGRLVFAKGYGYANREENIRVKPASIFRIASISKLITAVAIMKLVDKQMLSLDDKVFGIEGIIHDSAYLQINDKRLTDITVRHLLTHTAGWTRYYGDPAFVPHTIAERMNESLPLTMDTYIRFAISRNLHFTPGTMYSYSNMGYMFLGEIIERISGLDYETFVQQYILYPNGINDMHIGYNEYEKRFDHEVKYYEQSESEMVLSAKGDSALVPKSYGGNDIRLLGAAGGWVVSAPELAKLITLIDGNESIPDILSKQSIALMTSELEHTLGWSENNDGALIRTGSFAGTSGMVKCCDNGLTWVFLSNTSNWQGPRFNRDIDRLMKRIVSKIDLPKRDLFKYYPSDNLSLYNNFFAIDEV